MALDGERTPVDLGVREPSTTGSGAAGHWLGTALGPIGDLLARLTLNNGLARWISDNLWRRIFAANLVGLLIMALGFFFFWPEQRWVIEANRDALRIQAELIATAIATNSVSAAEKSGSDAFRLPEGEMTRVPYRDDGFAALELSIRPERVTPVLRRMIQPTRNRARIYGKDGTLVVDSAALLSRGQIRRSEPSPNGSQAAGRPKTKNFWTRLTAWLIDKELPVYTEIGTANGKAYPEVRQALTGAAQAMLLLDDGGQQILSVAVPIQRRNAVQGVLLLSTRPGDIDSRIWEGRIVVWTLFFIALLAVLGTSFLLARTVAEPMRRLSESADRVSRNITARQSLPDFPGRSDEVGQMASAFHAMTEALYRRSEASEKFAADVAHELKNPLTAARSVAESLGYAKTPEQRDQLVQQIQFELKRLNKLISDVSAASRLDAELARQQSRPVDVVAVLKSVEQIFRDILSDNSRKVVLDIKPGASASSYFVNGDDGRLGQVVTNLVDNAVSFSPEGGRVYIRGESTGGHVVLAIEDEGPGIPEDNLQKIFERFYSDRPETDSVRGKNSGLGLSISREIVKAHGGEIWAENRRDPKAGAKSKPSGARFVVRFPAMAASTTRGSGAHGRRS